MDTKSLARELRKILSRLKIEENEREIDTLRRALKDPLTRPDAKRAFSLAWEIVLSNLAVLRFFLYQKRNSFPYCFVDSSDLFHSGLISLFRAALKYDPEKASFSTYARYHLSNDLRAEAYRFCHAMSVPESAFKREGSRAKEAASSLFRSGPISLFAPAQPSGIDECPSILDELPDDSDPAEEAVSRKELESALSEVLKKLPDRERKILLLRLQEKTLKELARDFRVSHERIRQLENRALVRIRSKILSKDQKLKEILFRHWKEL